MQQHYIKGKRDLRLDWLRGYAILAMTLTHLGVTSPLIIITGGSTFLFNAAEVFFFTSGFTIGLISLGRPLTRQVSGRISRAWLIYKYVLIFTFMLSIIFGISTFTDNTQGVGIRELIATITLKSAGWGMDILVTYIIYLAISPLVLWALSRRRDKEIIIAIVVIYLLSTLDPSTTSLGFASFRHLGANSPIFFGALLIGYRRQAISQWWQSKRWNTYADITFVVIGVILLLLFLADLEWFHNIFGNFGIREFRMPPHNLIVVFLYLRILWLMVTHLWRFFDKALSWLVIPIGKDSLFTYCMHITLIEAYYTWIPFADEESSTLLKFAAEALVVGGLLGSVFARRYVTSKLQKSTNLAWLSNNMPNVLVSISTLLYISLLLLLSESGGWTSFLEIELDNGDNGSEIYDNDD